MFFCSRGPQTIEDLQQKLVQLTSQPSELGIGGTPPSHPATPHMPLSYDTYMQTLQQKLASISMTGGTHVVSESPLPTLLFYIVQFNKGDNCGLFIVLLSIKRVFLTHLSYGCTAKHWDMQSGVSGSAPIFCLTWLIHLLPISAYTYLLFF